jgi:hypothetical protein
LPSTKSLVLPCGFLVRRARSDAPYHLRDEF